ncbi:rod shape-determining protein RodA [Pueribacillus theae]|uniref:Rod shape-determining protein RodA n=1 Tax=Pueribacillus theae TaxID=2171751 RepID=A0A2U1K5B6_9BACI|nr:FtsW/RodA/SpoVE family cell cycle protein [Pueribacillus theae]PWA12690.1 rod shape-determining protein RodA [Pueribacillus theae]
MNKESRTPWQQIDYTILFLIFLLLCISIVAIHGAQPNLPVHLRDYNFVARQIIYYIIGLVAIGFAMVIDFDRFKQINWYLYGFGIFLLIALKFAPKSIAPIKNGAKSWFDIKYFGSIQPSEFMKIFLIITLSTIIAHHNEKYLKRGIREDFILVGKIAIVSFVPFALILTQPDLGTSLIILAIVCSLLLVSGIRWRILIGLFFAGILGVFLLIFTFLRFPDFFIKFILRGNEYQLDRIYGWLNPYENAEGIGYQLVKAMTAIGSGQLSGKGIGSNNVYLPESHTDFIFAIIGEQFGFIGTSIVISVFFMLIYRIIHTSLESNDPYGSYLCAGIIGMLTFQIFQNIGMNIGLLPITGIPLPFISFGGSSLLTSMLSLGVVLNVASRTKKYMFD